MSNHSSSFLMPSNSHNSAPQAHQSVSLAGVPAPVSYPCPGRPAQCMAPLARGQSTQYYPSSIVVPPVMSATNLPTTLRQASHLFVEEYRAIKEYCAPQMALYYQVKSQAGGQDPASYAATTHRNPGLGNQLRKIQGHMVLLDNIHRSNNLMNEIADFWDMTNAEMNYLRSQNEHLTQRILWLERQLTIGNRPAPTVTSYQARQYASSFPPAPTPSYITIPVAASYPIAVATRGPAPTKVSTQSRQQVKVAKKRKLSQTHAQTVTDQLVAPVSSAYSRSTPSIASPVQTPAIAIADNQHQTMSTKHMQQDFSIVGCANTNDKDLNNSLMADCFAIEHSTNRKDDLDRLLGEGCNMTEFLSNVDIDLDILPNEDQSLADPVKKPDNDVDDLFDEVIDLDTEIPNSTMKISCTVKPTNAIDVVANWVNMANQRQAESGRGKSQNGTYTAAAKCHASNTDKAADEQSVGLMDRREDRDLSRDEIEMANSLNAFMEELEENKVTNGDNDDDGLSEGEKELAAALEAELDAEEETRLSSGNEDILQMVEEEKKDQEEDHEMSKCARQAWATFMADGEEIVEDEENKLALDCELEIITG